MGFYKSEGILLRRHNLGEADRILTILTPQLGKIRAVAKGVRRGKSKLAGHLEPFVVTKLNLVQGRNLDIVTSAQGQRYYNLVSSDLRTLGLAHLLLEICDALLAEHEPNEPAYSLLNEALSALESGVDTILVRHYFYVKLLDCLGHRPEIDIALDQPSYYLELKYGTLSQGRSGQDSVELSRDTLKLWRLIFTNPLAQIIRVSSAAEIATRSQADIERFYDHQMGVRFRSELLLA